MRRITKLTGAAAGSILLAGLPAAPASVATLRGDTAATASISTTYTQSPGGGEGNDLLGGLLQSVGNLLSGL
jgi:hypothetical protein